MAKIVNIFRSAGLSLLQLTFGDVTKILLLQIQDSLTWNDPFNTAGYSFVMVTSNKLDAGFSHLLSRAVKASGL